MQRPISPRRAWNEKDYRLCLAACTAAGYDGPFTLIYDGPSDAEWKGLATERAFIEAYMPDRRTRDPSPSVENRDDGSGRSKGNVAAILCLNGGLRRKKPRFFAGLFCIN